MENRNANILVGSIATLLIVALFAFFLWLSRYSGEVRDEYDIFFQQSVAGLTVGSNVSFSGVPVGQVSKIALMPKSPEFVRVRIKVSRDVPILEGTTATLQGVGFTGVTEIQLAGAVPGAPKINQPGPFDVPIIPSRASGFGQLLETAPEVLERTSTALARINEVLSDENREAFATTLTNLDKATASLAEQGPEVKQALIDAQSALKSAASAAETIEGTSRSVKELLDEQGKPMFAELQKSIKLANISLANINRLTESAEPGVATLSRETIPEVNQLVADLSDLTRRLGAIASRIDEDPMGAMMGGRKLPSYNPKEARK